MPTVRTAGGRQAAGIPGDRDAIVETVNRYAWALDSKQCEQLREVFTADLHADYGRGAPWTNLDDFVRDMAAVHDRLDGTQHLVGNHLVSVTGDTATCASYAHCVLTRRTPEGLRVVTFGSRYDDELVRTTAGWRVRRRVARALVRHGDPSVVE